MKYRIAPVMLAGGIMLGGIAVAENRISVDTPQGRTVTVEAVTPTIFRVSNTAQGTAPEGRRSEVNPGRPGLSISPATVPLCGRELSWKIFAM